MRCKKCGKRLKENSDGDLRYCQGHGWLEPVNYDDPQHISRYEKKK